MKVLLKLARAPGDTILMTAALRDLHLSHPGVYTTNVCTPHSSVFDNNPHVEPFVNPDVTVDMDPDLTHTMSDSFLCTRHYLHGFHSVLERALKKGVTATKLSGEVYITPEEEGSLKTPHRFWILNAGWKDDFEVKRWSPSRFRKVVESFPDITFIQTGSTKHHHPEIKASNVVNMAGSLTLREFLILMRKASGVITPVSLPMHASAAVPFDGPGMRPCVVLAGGRECDVWEHYTGHAYLSRVGMLDCCLEGGCRNARFRSRNDGWEQDDRICRNVVKEDIELAECMADIEVDEVCSAVRRYERCQGR